MTYFAEAADVQAAFAAVVVDEWARAGVSDVVVSPGSRSTPLLVALAEAGERDVLQLHVVLDERSAGFRALGMAMGRGPGAAPVPVVTTSGTAAAELHPAVIEAHHAGVALLAVTADRPAELQAWGAPQTIDQLGLYGPAVRWSAAPGVPDMAGSHTWRSLASRAVAEARGGPTRPGPVHLNLAFREPLVGSVPEDLASLVAGRPDGRPWHEVSWSGRAEVPAEVLAFLALVGERGLVVAGNGSISTGKGADAVAGLSRATGWPVLAGPLSGCRLPGTVGAADALLRVDEVRAWQPEVVVRLGAPLASRVVNEWLAQLSCPQVLVSQWPTWTAPDRRPSHVVVAAPEDFCSALTRVLRPARQRGTSSPRLRGHWCDRWSLADDLAQAAIDASLDDEASLTEPGIARGLVGALPAGSTLVTSSSMPVRDVEWWSKPRHGVRFLANRGANGIDGVLSTAVGVATAGRAGPGYRTAALVGDLAFLYDAGALLGAAALGVDLDVVVVDNDGGGIFNFLPQAESQPEGRFERLWGTPHRSDIAGIARAYGVEVEEVADVHRLARAVEAGGPGKGLRVLLAKTERASNVAVHSRLHGAVLAALQGLG